MDHPIITPSQVKESMRTKLDECFVIGGNIDIGKLRVHFDGQTSAQWNEICIWFSTATKGLLHPWAFFGLAEAFCQEGSLVTQQVLRHLMRTGISGYRQCMTGKNSKRIEYVRILLDPRIWVGPIRWESTYPDVLCNIMLERILQIQEEFKGVVVQVEFGGRVECPMHPDFLVPLTLGLIHNGIYFDHINAVHPLLKGSEFASMDALFKPDAPVAPSEEEKQPEPRAHNKLKFINKLDRLEMFLSTFNEKVAEEKSKGTDPSAVENLTARIVNLESLVHSTEVQLKHRVEALEKRHDPMNAVRLQFVTKVFDMMEKLDD